MLRFTYPPVFDNYVNRIYLCVKIFMKLTVNKLRIDVRGYVLGWTNGKLWSIEIQNMVMGFSCLFFFECNIIVKGFIHRICMDKTNQCLIWMLKLTGCEVHTKAIFSAKYYSSWKVTFEKSVAYLKDGQSILIETSSWNR